MVSHLCLFVIFKVLKTCKYKNDNPVSVQNIAYVLSDVKF